MPGIKSLVRTLLTGVAGRYGYDVVARGHGSLGDSASVELLAQHLRELFPAAGIDLVIDCGANEGQYYAFIREKVGFTGPILSFEPQPELAARLRARAKAEDPQWTVFDCALGSREDTLMLQIMTGTGWSSLLQKSETVSSDRADTFSVARTVPVPVRPLDAVLDTLPQFQQARPYLKVDAQGFDLEVMRGAQQTLARAGALQTELGLIPVYEGAPSYGAMLRFLEEHRYEITGVFPVWRDSSLRIGEMDAVLRNMALFSAAGGTTSNERAMAMA